MNAFEFNKIAGAVLMALLVIFGTRTVSDIIFTGHPPEKPGFEIAILEGGGEGAHGGESKEVASVEPLPVRLAKADVGKGEKIAKKCAACHTFNKGGASRVGPNLYDIVGRDVASVEGFAYSQAASDRQGTWSYEDLECFMANPKKCLPGTKMAFAGVKKPDDRADLILYLHSLSDAPKALPEVQTSASNEAPSGGAQAAEANN